MLGDLRAGRAFLAAELSQSGWLDFGAFRWRDVAPGRASRAAVGVITPLAIGVAIGRVEFGSFAALGALPAGFVSFRGITRTRIVAVVLAAAGMAVSTLVGATAEAGHPWLLVPVIFCWAYAAGLLAALGPTAAAVSLQWPVALLIASALPLAPGEAAVRALLVLAGGLWQGLLVVSSWAIGRGSAERTAMSASFLALAGYASDLAAGSQEPPGPATVAGRQALRDPNPLMRNAARLQLLDLTEEAERIRDSLTAVNVGRVYGDQSGGRDLLSTAALVLGELAEALTSWPAHRAEHLDAARQALRAASADPDTRRDWAGAALLGQLRAAWRITEALNESEPAGKGRAKSARPRPPQSLSVDMLITLRASLGTSSEAGRHALRLAVVTAVAEVIVHAAELSHGYWGVLTIFIVLRPDYSSTLYRGLQRAAGTVVGAGLGFLTVLIGHIGLSVMLGVIAVSLVAAYAVFTVNYLLYAVFLTDFVVVLLALLGLPPGPTVEARLVGTGVGTGLALLAYIVWPTWEGTSAGEKFARLFALQGRLASALLRAYTRPGNSNGARRELQLAARRARTDADASADRLAGEPEHPPMTGELARALIAVGHRIAQACIALNAAVTAHHSAQGGLPSRSGPPSRSGSQSKSGPPSRSGPLPGPAQPSEALDAVLQPRLDALADDVAAASAELARMVRGLDAADPQPRAPFPVLRVRHQALWMQPQVMADADVGQPDQPAGSRGQDQRARGETAAATGETAGLFAATDGLVDAINTAAHILQHPDQAR